MSDNKKYYWLKLKRDFFKRHDMKIIEAMDNGKDYLLFYLKLLLESIDHEGDLRFSDTIPYNDKMLSVITDTNIDIVRSAVKLFAELGMMTQLEDGTLYMEHVQSMLGSETSEAIRIRELRAKKKQVLIAQEESVQCTETYEKRTPELEIELDKELEIDKDIPPDKPAKLKKTYDDQFNTFYQAYPKKIDKIAASKKFNTVIRRGITLETILSKLEVYKNQIVDNKIDAKYIRGPVRFLDSLDDYDISEKATIPEKKILLCQECGVELRFGVCPSCLKSSEETNETF